MDEQYDVGGLEVSRLFEAVQCIKPPIEPGSKPREVEQILPKERQASYF